VRLWLLRHGEAQAQAPSDERRALTEHGRREVLDSLAQLSPLPEAILASPYLRAQQSAALAVQQLGYGGAVETVSWLTPDEDPREVADKLCSRQEDSLLLVAHQPLLGALAGWLCEGHRQAALAMRTASLACLEGDLPLAGGMRLVSLYHPRIDR